MVDQDVRQFAGEMVGNPLEGMQAAEVLGEEAEDLGVVHFAPECPFPCSASPRDRRDCRGRVRRKARSVATSMAGVRELVEQDGMAIEGNRLPRTTPDDVSHPA